jgi:hypothetical protein
MITKFARLKFELFTKPSKLDFLRVHQASLPLSFCRTPQLENKNNPRLGKR